MANDNVRERSTQTRVWVVRAEVFGYPLLVVAKTQAEARSAMLKEYREHPGRETNFKTWDAFAEHFGAWEHECPLGKVVWP